MSELTPRELLVRAKVKLQETHIFFASLLMRLRMVESPEIGTAGVNAAGDLYYSPGFIEGLTEKHRIGLMIHEVGHIILEHPWRFRKSWDKDLQNVAMDVKVNDLLQTEGFELPASCIKVAEEHTFTFTGKGGKSYTLTDIQRRSFEEVYAFLEKHAERVNVAVCGAGEGGGGAGAGGSGGGGKGGEGRKKKAGLSVGKLADSHEHFGEVADNAAGARQRAQWKRRIAEAAILARQRGVLSGSLEELVGELISPAVMPEELLRRHVASMIPCDQNWLRPRKQGLALGYYLPSVKREYLEAVVHIDSSGSISNKALRVFFGWLVDLLRAFAMVKVTLLVCDAEVHDVVELDTASVDQVYDYKVKGRGGTSHVPVVKWIEENKPECRLLISLTDGYSDIPEAYRQLPDEVDRLFLVPEGSTSPDNLEKHGTVIPLPSE